MAPYGTIIRYCPEQPQFVEKAVRYLRKANEVDGQGRNLLHMLVLSSDDRPIVRPISVENSTDGVQRRIMEVTIDAVKRFDTRKRMQRSKYALLYHAGVDPCVKNRLGKTSIVAYLDQLGSVTGKASDHNFDQLVEINCWEALRLFYHSDCVHDAGNREELLEALDDFINRRGGLVAGSMLLSTRENLARAIQKASLVATHLALPQEFTDIGTFPVEDLFPNRFAEKVLKSIRGERPQGLNPKELESLRSDGLDVDTKGKSGVILLFCSYIMKNHKWFESLIKSGESPILPLSEDLSEHVDIYWRVANGIDFCPERGENVLLAIALNPFDRAVYLKTAMQHWRQWNDCDDLRRNVMHRILFHRVPEAQTDLVLELATTGVDLNAQSIGGATPCHIAVFRNASLIPKLVEKGADVNIRDFRGLTVMDLLKRSVEEMCTFHEENAKVLNQLQGGQN
ncbi:hypothetical protein SH449x_000020 [Pirellulaceae bacterium SH449]